MIFYARDGYSIMFSVVTSRYKRSPRSLRFPGGEFHAEKLIRLTQGSIWEYVRFKRCYRDVTEMLQEALQRCYRDVTEVLQRCYRGVTEVLQRYYRGYTEVL
jgi:hypothetical protein